MKHITIRKILLALLVGSIAYSFATAASTDRWTSTLGEGMGAAVALAIPVLAYAALDMLIAALYRKSGKGEYSPKSADMIAGIAYIILLIALAWSMANPYEGKVTSTHGQKEFYACTYDAVLEDGEWYNFAEGQDPLLINVGFDDREIAVIKVGTETSAGIKESRNSRSTIIREDAPATTGRIEILYEDLSSTLKTTVHDTGITSVLLGKCVPTDGEFNPVQRSGAADLL